MRKLVLVCLALTFLLGSWLVPLVPAPAAQATPLPTFGGQNFSRPGPKTYNLYATDGMWFAPNTPAVTAPNVYVYGFTMAELEARDPLPGSTVPAALAAYRAAPSMANLTGLELALRGKARVPAPKIDVFEGDLVTINLVNLGISSRDAPSDPHSIHLHGLDVAASQDGVPETSVAAVPKYNNDGTLNSGTPGFGNTVVYMFATSPSPGMNLDMDSPMPLGIHEGSYFYHCHQEADIHVQMGMYGTLTVHNATDTATATVTDPAGDTWGTQWKGSLYGWNFDKEYTMLLTEIDYRQHDSEFTGLGDFNPVDYRPQNWYINGASFPWTVLPNPGAGSPFALPAGAIFKPFPGYDVNIQGKLTGGKFGPQRVLLRMINLGFETQPMHMHGFHAKVIGSDQRGWPWANRPNATPLGRGLEKQTTTIGSGEAYDLLLDMRQQQKNGTGTGAPAAGTVDEMLFPGAPALSTNRYSPGTESRYNQANNQPQPNTLAHFPPIPDPFLPPATYVGGPPVPQVFPYHNHDDYKATNNGAYPGGMFTMITVLP